MLGLADVAQRPTVFSTFLMWVLAELFEALPEVGDPEKPSLVFFFDEAHLLFADAGKGFLEAVTRTVRLIRSKGVGVFFVTQLPTDLPDDVLSQLGNRVQHAVRAFTAKDAKGLKQAVQTFPTTEHYDLSQTLQSLGVGEAVVTVLDPRGVPTPVAATRLFPPASRMDPLTAAGARGDHRGLAAAAQVRRADRPRERRGAPGRARGRRRRPRSRPPGRRPRRAPPREAPRSDDSLLGTVGDLINSRQGQAISKEIVRGVFGMLKKRR